MGASVSLYEASQLPNVIEREKFDELTESQFEIGAYEAFADQNGKVSKERLLEVISMTDCYISHEWGIDKERRSTHDRVLKINHYLSSKGLYTYLDEGQVLGMNTNDKLRDRIRKAQCVIICMTDRYFSHLKQEGDNRAKLEFFETMKTKDLRYIIPVVMESAAYTIPEVITSVYPKFRVKPHFDLTKFDDPGASGEELVNLQLYVSKMIRPLRNGAFFKQQRGDFYTTIVGRHYRWLLEHVPKLGHKLSIKYAEMFLEEKIESTARLWQLLQHDTGFLESINVPHRDAVMIRLALRADLQGNFDSQSALKITAIIEEENRKIEENLAFQEQCRIQAVDMQVMNKEKVLMSVEDIASHHFREKCKSEIEDVHYVKSRQELLDTVEAQRKKYEVTMKEVQNALRARIVKNDMDARTVNFHYIAQLEKPALVCAVLYKLFVKIDRETKHLIPDQYFLDDQDRDEMCSSAAYRENEAAIRLRIQSFIARATENLSDDGAIDRRYQHVVGWSDAEREANDECEHETKNSRLIYLLQEASYICCSITNLTQYNRTNVLQFSENGIVKLITSLLSHTYLFNCSFESLFLPQSYHFLCMPTEVLVAISSMIKCGVGRRNVNLRLAFLFKEVGVIPLTIEVIKFHLNDPLVLRCALDLMYTLIDSPGVGPELQNVRALMSDVNNVLLFIVVMEKFYDQQGPDIVALMTNLLAILSHAMRVGEWDVQFSAFRGYLIPGIFNDTLPLVDMSDQEQIIRFCAIIEDVWFDESLLKNHLFTSEFIPPNERFLYEIRERFDRMQVLRFLRATLLGNCTNDEITVAAFVALGNVVFESDEAKEEAYRLRLHEIVASIVRSRMMHFNNSFHADTSNQEKHSRSRSEMEVKMDIELQDGSDHDSDVEAEEEENEGKTMAASIDQDLNRKFQEVEKLRNQDPSYSAAEEADKMREVIYEGLITCANLIIVPPFSTFDTARRENPSAVAVGKTTLFPPPAGGEERGRGRGTATTTTTTTTTTAPVGLAAEVREETKNAAVYFLRHGMAELTLDIVSHYSRDRLLVHSTLVFVHKLVYRGRYICCLRLLTIGFCEELTELMRTYIGDQEIYMLCTMILSSMASSHPLLVGTGRRFVSSHICELLVSSLRRQCHEKDDRSPLDEQQHQQQQQVVVDGSAIRSDRKCSSDARRWMHYSYPYCCRVCLVHCTAVYCLVTHSGGERGYATGDVIHALRREGFQGLLVNAPGIQLDPHQLLHSSHITTVGSAAVDANTAAAPQLDPTAVVKKGGFGQDEVLNSNGDATATGAGRSDDAAEDDGRLLASGVFHNASSCIAAFTGITNNPASGTVHSASAIPPRKNYTAAAMGGGEGPTAMQTAAATSNEYDRQMLAYQGAVRNVEYLARMTRSEKDHIMNTLFNIFNVEESPNLLV